MLAANTGRLSGPSGSPTSHDPNPSSKNASDSLFASAGGDEASSSPRACWTLTGALMAGSHNAPLDDDFRCLIAARAIAPRTVIESFAGSDSVRFARHQRSPDPNRPA